MSEPSPDRRVELVIESLQTRFGEGVGPDLIRAEVEAGFAVYSEAQVREFVPVLVEARVRSHLTRHSAEASTSTESDPSNSTRRNES